MRSKRKRAARYVRGIMGIPSFVVAAMWVGIWFLWPDAGRSSLPSDMPTPRVAYVPFDVGEGSWYLRPDVFGRPLSIGFSLPAQGEDVPASPAGRHLPRPRLLERNGRMSNTAYWEPAQWRKAASCRGEAGYRPHWTGDKVFARPDGYEMRFVVDMSRSLRRRGLVIPDLSGKGMVPAEGPWTAVLLLDVNRAGRPEHVFVEAGTGQPDVDSDVARVLYRASAPGSGGPCSGRVTISYCRVPVSRRGAEVMGKPEAGVSETE